MQDFLLSSPENTGEVVRELFDIEPLIAPGIDWVFWIESGLWTVAGLLVLLVALYLLRFLYRPLLFKWQLGRLVKLVPESQENLSQSELSALYEWLRYYRAWLKPVDKTAPQYLALLTLIQQVDTACFSQQVVSRETYLGFIKQAQVVLRLKTLNAFKSRRVMWK